MRLTQPGQGELDANVAQKRVPVRGSGSMGPSSLSNRGNYYTQGLMCVVLKHQLQIFQVLIIIFSCLLQRLHFIFVMCASFCEETLEFNINPSGMVILSRVCEIDHYSAFRPEPHYQGRLWLNRYGHLLQPIELTLFLGRKELTLTRLGFLRH